MKTSNFSVENKNYGKCKAPEVNPKGSKAKDFVNLHNISLIIHFVNIYKTYWHLKIYINIINA